MTSDLPASSSSAAASAVDAVAVPSSSSAVATAPTAAADVDEDAAAAASAVEYAALIARTTASEKVAAGRAYLKAGVTDRAVDLLAMALEEYVAKYGEFSLHCAVVYRSYGSALLAHYQAHSSVLGDVIGGDESKKKRALGDGDDEEEDDAPQADNEDLTLAYQVLETARVIYARHYTGPGKPEELRADEEGVQQEERKEQEQAAAAAASSPAAASSTSAASAEVVETAAAPAAPVDTSLPELSQKEIGLALSYTYEILASFFMEREDFTAAAADYVKSLALAEPHMPAHSRDLAATHMDIAVCALFDSKPEQALASYTAANEVLKLTLVHLKEEITRETANPTPVALVAAPFAVPAIASSSAAASSPAAPEAAEAPVSNLATLKKQLSECADIMDELKERLEDITAQLALPAEDQALALIKQQNLSGASPLSVNAAPAAAANPFAMPAAGAAAAANPFAMPAAAAAAAAAAAPAAAPVATHAPQVKRKQKPAAAPTTATATAAAVVDRAADEEGAAAKRQKA